MKYLLPVLSSLTIAQAFADPVEIRGRFPLDGVRYLGSGGSPTACGTDWRESEWEVIGPNGAIQLRHVSSGKALGFSANGPAAVEPDEAATFEREDAGDGWFRLRSRDRGLVHYENRTGTLEAGGEPRDDWWSAQWQIIQRTDEHELASPDGRNRITFSLANGMPEYSVIRDGEPVISPSPLGFVFNQRPPLTGPFRVVKTKRSTIDETWTPVWGEKTRIHNHGEEVAIRLEETSTTRRLLDLVFRAYDDGVAFRYILPEQPNLTDFEITDEVTGFHFTADGDAWWCEDLPDTY
jgi:hypothetical protein